MSCSRSFIVAAGALLMSLIATDARAETAVPLRLQAELLAKVASYDKTLPGRAGGLVRVVVVVRHGDDESSSTAGHLRSALSGMSEIAGVPHEDSTVEFTDAPALAELAKSRTISIFFFAPGFAELQSAIAAALAGIPVLTVSALPENVRKGAILGFELVGGKPRLLVNLSQSRNQGVVLAADVLRLATVIQ